MLTGLCDSPRPHSKSPDWQILCPSSFKLSSKVKAGICLNLPPKGRPLREVCFPTPWSLGQRRSRGAEGSWCVSLRSAGAQRPGAADLSERATSFVLRVWRQHWFTMSRAGYLPPCNPISMWQWMLPHTCLYVYKLQKSLLWDGAFFFFLFPDVLACNMMSATAFLFS